MKQARPIAFVLASTDHGALLVNRNDYAVTQGVTFGVGHDLLRDSSFAQQEIGNLKTLLQRRRECFGDGVLAIDCGANIGVHTVEMARFLAGWGEVVAIEAQERIFYALAGNVTLNNCFNARLIWGAVGASSGTMGVPRVDYSVAASYGSLELQQRPETEYIGQSIDYAPGNLVKTRLLSIDELELPRVDLIKIDIEGMEVLALTGALATIARSKPMLVIEKIKSDESALKAFLRSQGYVVHAVGMNLLAVHESDPAASTITVA